MTQQFSVCLPAGAGVDINGIEGVKAFDFKAFAEQQSSWKSEETISFSKVLGKNADLVAKRVAWLLIQTPNGVQHMILTNTNTHGHTIAGGKARGSSQIWAQVPKGTIAVPTGVEGQVVGLPHVTGG